MATGDRWRPGTLHDMVVPLYLSARCKIPIHIGYKMSESARTHNRRGKCHEAQ